MWRVVRGGTEEPYIQIFYENIKHGIIHLNSSYAQFIPEQGVNWGTSLSLFPTFHFLNVTREKKRSGGGKVITYDYNTLGNQLAIQLQGKTQYEHLDCNVKLIILPPCSLSRTIEIEVIVSLSGSVKFLDNSFPWEPFGTVYLSSMFFDDKTYNCASATAVSIGKKDKEETKEAEIPKGGMIFGTKQKANKVSLSGGDVSHRTIFGNKIMPLDLSNCVQNNSPSVGWVGKATNPNENNVGLWFSHSSVINRYSYVVIYKNNNNT